MKTKESKKLLAAAVILTACLIVVRLAGSIQGGEKSYEVKPRITLPEYRTDTARAIDAYERVMERFVNLAERSLMAIDTDIKDIGKRLHSIDCKLTELSARMARIEKAVGVRQAEKSVEKGCQAKPQNRTNTAAQPAFEESVQVQP